jgi:hypothetical protein
MPKPQKEKIVQPWDRRPWPDQGDADKGTIYHEVGRFLSFWEKYEAALAYLFSAFLGAFPVSEPARRAFFSVRTFEGRADMLRAVSSAYFDRRPDKHLQDRFKDILSQSVSFSPRRNEIAHGFVDSFGTEVDWRCWGWSDNHNTFALYPSIASFKERDLGGIPSYCMTSNEISYFYDCILRLQPCGGHAPTVERTLDPARIIGRELDPRPGIREQPGSGIDKAALIGGARSRPRRVLLRERISLVRSCFASVFNALGSRMTVAVSFRSSIRRCGGRNGDRRPLRLGALLRRAGLPGQIKRAND